MKKRLTFLCLGVLLFTCTFAFAAETKQQLASKIVDILYKDKVQIGLNATPSFSLAIYNTAKSIIDPTSTSYISNPRKIIDDTLGSLSKELKQAIVDEQVFEHVAKSVITDVFGPLEVQSLKDSLRKEVVHSLLSKRESEQEDFAKEIEFLRKCAVLLSKQPEDKASMVKSERLMSTELGRILAETTGSSGSYSQARTKALEILRQEENLGLKSSFSFIDKLKESLSYAKGSQYFEGLASNETIDLESRSNFYSQAAEEYKKYDEKKSAAMKGKVQEMQEKIGALNKDIDSALQEADRLAGEGDWKAAVQKLDNALADFNKIGQKRGNREVELEGKKSGYKSAIDLAEKIKR